MTRCLVCSEPTNNLTEICELCEEEFKFADEEESPTEIGVPSNAKLTEGFRMLKGQGE